MRIKVIANYFGTVPSYFQYWIDSIRFNEKITWLCYTDQNLDKYDAPPNLLIRRSCFQEMKNLLRQKLNLEPDYHTPWDLCKFKIAFGKVFEDELEDADYWAWTDCDMIYGDLSISIKECERGFDKVMPKGHLSFIKNSKALTEAIVTNSKVRSILDAKLDCKNTGCIDEEELRFEILPKLGARQNDLLPYANFYPRYGHFQLQDALALCLKLGYHENPIPGLELPCVFTWRDGHLWGWFAMPGGGVRTEECVYIHFFKREIKMLAQRLVRGKSYLIAPNWVKEYDGHDLEWREIANLDRHRIHWSYFAKRFNMKTIARKLGLK